MNAYAILGIKLKTQIGTNVIMSLRSVYLVKVKDGKK